MIPLDEGQVIGSALCNKTCHEDANIVEILLHSFCIDEHAGCH